MKKGLFKVNLFVSLFSLCLVGCHPRYIKGQILRIEETYNKGFITRNDLLNIAYYIDNEVKYNDEEFEIKKIDYEKFDENIQYSIKVATQKYIFKDDGYEPKIDDLEIVEFFGNYDKVYVIQMYDKNVCVDILRMDRYIDGVLIKSLSVGSYPGIVCWVKD